MSYDSTGRLVDVTERVLFYDPYHTTYIENIEYRYECLRKYEDYWDEIVQRDIITKGMKDNSGMKLVQKKWLLVGSIIWKSMVGLRSTLE